MAKLFFSAATALFAATAIGVHAGDVSTCTAIDFTAHASDFTSLNTVIDLAVSSNLLATYLVDVDPLVVTNQVLDAVDFSLLGLSFELTPTIDSLNVTGISTIAPRHLNVTSADTLDIGADFKGTVSATATVTLSIQQLNHKWYQICWTDILHPTTCGATSITVDVSVGVVEPSLAANLTADMLGCPTGSTTATCPTLTVTQILVAAISGDFTTILNRILLRFTNAAVNSLTLSFTSLSELSFDFKDSGAFVTQIIKSLLDFTVEIINKKGDAYNTVISLTQTLGKSLLNNIITEYLAPLFGSTCFDEGY